MLSQKAAIYPKWRIPIAKMFTTEFSTGKWHQQDYRDRVLKERSAGLFTHFHKVFNAIPAHLDSSHIVLKYEGTVYSSWRNCSTGVMDSMTEASHLPVPHSH